MSGKRKHIALCLIYWHRDPGCSLLVLDYEAPGRQQRHLSQRPCGPVGVGDTDMMWERQGGGLSYKYYILIEVCLRFVSPSTNKVSWL